MLCSNCSGIFDGTRKLTGFVSEDNEEPEESHDEEPNLVYYSHYPTLRALLQSAGNGCHICFIISNMFSHDENGGLMLGPSRIEETDGPIQYSIEPGFSRPPATHGDYNVLFESESFTAVIDLFKLDNDYTAVQEPLSSGQEPDSTATYETWQVAMNWLDDCVAHHSTCRGSGTDARFLPTRLIDVGDALSNSVRLCESASLDNLRERYMTLSHCWGKKKFQTLTTNCLEDFKDHIPVGCLSKTFLDAIAITRRCNIQYLWIDSLCIIQDSAEDWAIESALMAEVYTNSFLNIAATAARDGDHGCFVARDRLSIDPCITSINRANAEDPSLLPTGQYMCIDKHIWDNGVETAPLNTRAWVVQERYLAPRILHFGRHHIFWECCEKQLAEAHPPWLATNISTMKQRSSLEDIGWLRWHQFSNASRTGEADLSKDHEGILAPYSSWEDIVRSYTKCNLTVDTDKLVALSGIAREMQKQLGDQYVAGMWRQHLVYQLLWRGAAQGYLSRPKKYCAPTWSWASVVGAVVNACMITWLDHRDVLITVEDVQVELASKNEFGALSSGALRIRGPLMVADLVLEHIHSDEDGRDYEFPRLFFHGLKCDLAPALDAPLRVPVSKTPQEVYLLPIIYSLPGEWVGDNQEAYAKIEGILLQPSDNARGEYCRVGRFMLAGSEPCLALLEEEGGISAMDDLQDGIETYVAQDGPVDGVQWTWRQYKITII